MMRCLMNTEFESSLWKLLTTSIALIGLIICKVSSEDIVLSSLNYDVNISSCLAQTTLRAVFHNRGILESEEPFELLLPEEAFVSSLVIETKNQTYTSTITRKERRGKTSPTPRGRAIKLKKRDACAQRLQIPSQMDPGEKFKVRVEYSHFLQRKGSLYHLNLYLPCKKPQSVNLDITIRMLGVMKNITFLKADGHGEPLKTLKEGTAEVYSLTGGELHLKFSRNVSSSPFGSFTHKKIRTEFSKKKSQDPQLSFQPPIVPKLLLPEPAYVLSFDMERFPNGGIIQIQKKYFTHFLSPEGLAKLPVHTVFVLDISGSMEESNKMSDLKRAMQVTLQRMKEEDSFEVFVFSTYVKSLGIYKGTSQDILRSTRKIHKLRPYGGTNINLALLDSVEGANYYKKSKGVKQIVFLTDGNRTVGELDSEVIRRDVRSANTGEIPIYAVAFGDDADMKFLRQISKENGGFARKIHTTVQAANQFEEFYKEISTPLINNVSVDYPADEVELDSIVKLGRDNFYSGEEIVLAGKLKTELTSVTPKITANGAKGRIQLQVSRQDLLRSPPPNKTSTLERIWAYLSVKDLLAANEYIEDKSIRAEHRSRALEIALMYNFVTPLTSMVISEPTNWTSDGTMRDDRGLTLVSLEDGAAALPSDFKVSLSSNKRFFWFVDNDPHFVVEVPGLALPLCFDLHGEPGDAFSLVRDEASGLIVNAEVSAALGKPGATYFTKVFISLKHLNLTITTDSVAIGCRLGNEENEISEIWDSDEDLFERRWTNRVRRRHLMSSRRAVNKKTMQRRLGAKYRHKHRQKYIFNGRKVSGQMRRPKRYYNESRDSRSQERDEKRAEYEKRRKSTAEEKNSSVNVGDDPTEHRYSIDPPIIDGFLVKDHSVDRRSRQKHVKIKFDTLYSPINSREIQSKLMENMKGKKSLKHNPYSYPNFSTGSHVLQQESKSPKHSCAKDFAWQYFGQKRYDDVVLMVRGKRRRRRLDVIVSDVNLHVVVTNTKNRNGQSFLGFYIQAQRILSPNTTGVIGQFVYKSVGTVGHYPELYINPENQQARMIPLIVVHFPQEGISRAQVSQLMAVVSKRRSLLQRKKVLCLHVKRHGKGLLARRPKDYILSNLHS